MADHAIYSASGFEAAALCPGKAVMEHGLADRPSIYSAKGTLVHSILEKVIQGDGSALKHVGDYAVEGYDLEFTEDDAANVTAAAEAIQASAAQAGGEFSLCAEQTLNYAEDLGVAADLAWGTADAIVIAAGTLEVHDYKNGRTPVEPDCAQLKLYGVGALRKYEPLGPFGEVKLVVHQPNVYDAPQVAVFKPEELIQWVQTDGRAAVNRREGAALGYELVRGQKDPAAFTLERANWIAQFLNPGEKQCQFCRAGATCPARRIDALEAFTTPPAATPAEFEEAPLPTPLELDTESDAWLTAFMRKADALEDFIKAVRAEMEARLFKGRTDLGFKLVAGKKGARAWANRDEVEQVLKNMRLKVEEMYTLKLVSPTAAEKLAKAGVIGPRQWAKLQERVTQNEGKPHVVPDTDKRSAIVLQATAEEFPLAAGGESFA